VLLLTGNDKPEIIKNRILKQNTGISKDKNIFVEMVGKQPKTNTKNKVKQINLNDDVLNIGTQAIAINIKDTNYICIDFDGYSNKDKTTETAEYTKEKHDTANHLADEFIKLLKKQTDKFRIDKTASDKRHIWLKQPRNIINKKQLDLKDKFLTPDGATAAGLVEVFTNKDKHYIHLAGSSIKNNTTINDTAKGGADNERLYYTNIYAGAAFDELAEVTNIKQIIITAAENAGYITKLDGSTSKGNEYYNINNLYLNGSIRKHKYNNILHFAYIEDAAETKIYQCAIDDFTPENIIAAEIDEVYKKALLSVYYSDIKSIDNKQLDNTVIADDITDKLIELYAKYWHNTDNRRHDLILATSHILVNHLKFNDKDLDNFFIQLADRVNIDFAQHKTIIREGLKEYTTAYGVPTIIDILQCTSEEISFIFEYDDAGKLEAEAENIERIKPTVTKEIKELEAGFKKLYNMQLANKFAANTGNIKTLEIKPTHSITDLIKQLLNNMLLNEDKNIAKLLLEYIAVILGINRCYIVVTGVSSGGKSALVDTVKLAIPSRFIKDIDSQSDKAFERYVQTKGENAYNRIIIDVGDKGDFKGFEIQKEKLGTYQSLITKGAYTYQVVNKTNDNITGTIELTIKTDGFAQVITTTKDAAAYFDEQLATRSTIIYIGNHEFNNITEFQQELGQKKLNKKITKLTKLIRGHILYNLNKYNDINLIIVDHWRDYIKDLLIQHKAVNRQVEATIKAFKAYCWLEIERLTTVKGTDGKTYYIPDTDILTSFIDLYGVKTSRITKTEYQIIKWLHENKKFEIMDTTPDYDTEDLKRAETRKEAQLFTYKDLEALLKAGNKKLYNKINNVSELCRKLENNEILSRIPDSTTQRNIVYYISKVINANSIDNITVKIKDSNIKYALNHLRHVETIETNGDTIDDILNELGGDRPKFAPDTDFSFIDKRGKDKNIIVADAPENNNINIPDAATINTPQKKDHKKTKTKTAKTTNTTTILKPVKTKKKIKLSEYFKRGATISDELINNCNYWER